MNETDLDALERAIVAARAQSPGRREQIDSMLADQKREDVAAFAARVIQGRALNLQPWQVPPMRASLAALSEPYGDPSGRRESAELLKRLLDAGLSRFEPDPVGALAEAERRRAV